MGAGTHRVRGLSDCPDRGHNLPCNKGSANPVTSNTHRIQRVVATRLTRSAEANMQCYHAMPLTIIDRTDLQAVLIAVCYDAR